VEWNQRLRRENAFIGLAITEGRPLVSANLLTDERVTLTPESRARIERSAYRAVLAVPLVAHDRILGALAVGDRAGRIFTRDDMELVQGFADQAALAVANAELFQETRARLQQMRRLAELSQPVTSSPDQR